MSNQIKDTDNIGALIKKEHPQKQVGVSDVVMAFIVHYLNHYCVVSISQKTLLIKDENDQIVTKHFEEEEDRYLDVFKIYNMVPDIVIGYIDENIDNLNKIKAAKEILADKEIEENSQNQEDKKEEEGNKDGK